MLLVLTVLNEISKVEMNSVLSPFEGEVIHLDRVHVSEFVRKYRQKCGVNISDEFFDIEYADLYLCKKTGYKFWHPYELAGRDSLYKKLSFAWPHYYQTNRWEYSQLAAFISSSDNCLEIGCGRGYFIRLIEGRCQSVKGIEFNQDAIKEKVCDSVINLESAQSHQLKCSTNFEKYDKIFSFQVLEHISNPAEFFETCIFMLKSGGHLIVSVPDDNFVLHRDMADAFNLPPHHVGCYNDSVFKKIGEIYNLKVINIKHAPPTFPGILASESSRNSISWRVFLKFINPIGEMLLRVLKEPGHTMLVTLQKV